MASSCLLDSTVIIDAINDRNGRSQLLEELLAEGTLLACCPIKRRNFSPVWSSIL
jgi:hypothetical protein